MSVNVRAAVAAMFLVGCAGVERDCSSWNAGAYGADWLIVQYRFDGTPVNCWQLHDVSVSNEQASDGIYWTGGGGHLVHISGWYNRVQVAGGDFPGASKVVGINLAACGGGKYDAPVVLDETVISP